MADQSKSDFAKSVAEKREELRAEGLRMELSGNKLDKFVTDEMAAWREDKKAWEREERERQDKKEREERERQDRKEREEKEREEREREREHELKMAELKLRAETGADRRSSSGSNGESVSSEGDALGAGRGTEVKMAPFDCKTDQIERFLTQFEKLAKASRVPYESWAIQLSGLLRDSAKEVYHQLSDEAADDYDALRAALLRRFQVTAETYRQRFRKATKQANETHEQFHRRVLHFLDKWMSMAKVDPSDHKGVWEEFAKEVVLGSYGTELTFHLETHGATSLAEIAVAAERFDAAEQKRAKGRKEAARYEKPPALPRNDSHGGGKPEAHPRKVSQATAERPPVKRGWAKCFRCGREGHISRDCPQHRPSDRASLHALLGRDTHGLVTERGKVNGREYDIVLDSGCTYPAVIDSRMVRPEDMTGETVDIEYNDRDVRTFPVAYIDIDCRYVSGRIKAACFDDPKHQVILGCRHVICPDPHVHCAELHALTRAQSKASEPEPLPSPAQVPNTSAEEMKRLQADDSSLQHLRALAVNGTTKKSKTGEVMFLMQKGLLYRRLKTGEADTKQLVVPTAKRTDVLRLAHEGLFCAHTGITKTHERVTAKFYWPGVAGDVRRYVRSCDVCQRTATRANAKPAPLGEVPVIDEPFKRVAMDLIGPIKPASERGHRYIITVVDYATRFAEASALKNVETETVAEALLEIWSRVGIPEEVLTDQGSQFVGRVMAEVNRLLSIKHLTTTPYHPQCNGLVERFNGTLKAALRKLSEERPRDWDRYIPALLFAYREAPQTSLGFSPFELVYGRTVRGPMAVLRKLWTDEETHGEVKTSYEYVTDLQQRLETIRRLARENLNDARAKQANHYNRKAVVRDFTVGERVLLLLPTVHNKLQVRWRGPYVITEKLNGLNYRIQVGTKEKTFHVNLLKRYIERPAMLLMAAVVNEEAGPVTSHGTGLPSCPMSEEETYRDARVSPDLTTEQKKQVTGVLEKFADVMTDKPGLTSLAEFTLTLNSDVPVKMKPYPLPHAKEEAVKAEIREMARLGLIERAEGPYCSPIVLVRKKDGSYRFCVDYRRLNAITEFVAEPLPDPEGIFARLAKARYFTRIDLTKGYWQIPVRKEDRHKLAFTTPEGNYQWKVMPFGVQNAPGVFTRMMRKLLEPLAGRGVENFMDDVLIATETWEGHLTVLHDLLQLLRDAHLTARPTKCEVGWADLDFLGHRIGRGTLAPANAKVEKLLAARRPETKKEVRSFLGLANYYRRYVPNFSAIAAPLSDMLRGKSPDKVGWSDSCQTAFETLKSRLASNNVTKMPDMAKQFFLRTDASERGVGAVLLQEHDGQLHPVAYHSRKLSTAEQAYSTSEKECLAIVFGIEKNEPYLYGNRFILECDHQPLAYLEQAKHANKRLMRWSLFLQQYRPQIRYIKGTDNVGADFLSRHPDPGTGGIDGTLGEQSFEF